MPSPSQRRNWRSHVRRRPRAVWVVVVTFAVIVAVGIAVSLVVTRSDANGSAEMGLVGRHPTSSTTVNATAEPTASTSTASTTAPAPTVGGLIPLAIDDGSVPVSYSREEFGDWIDADRDCRNTRAEVLIAESRATVTFTTGSGCTVATGRWTDPWSGKTDAVARALDVDHDVPLANAWRSGAWKWDHARRVMYANDLADPEHLNAIPSGENRAKGDDGPEDWRPPARASWCRYAREWDAIKVRWELTATTREWAALVEMAATC